MTVLRRRLSIGVGALGLVLLALIAPIVDVIVTGPYTTWYNTRCRRLAEEHHLMGKDERAVVEVLGTPSSVDRGWDKVTTTAGTPTEDARRWVTYNYAPCPWFPYAKFQVHLTGGVVAGLEMFDD